VDSKAPTSRARRLLRRLLVALLVLLALYGAIRLGRVPERIAVALLERSLESTVTVGRVSYEWPDRIVASGVKIVLPAASSPFVTLDRIALAFDFAPPALRSVSVEDATLYLRERADGSFDLPPSRASSEAPSRLPQVNVTRARVALTGAGPLHERIATVLAERMPRSAEFESLTLAPADDGGFELSGAVNVAAATHVRVNARGRGGRLELVTARVSEQRPIDLVAARKVVSPALADWLEQNQMKGQLAGFAQLFFDGKEGEPPRLEADLNLLDVALTSVAFPYPVEGLRGRLEFRGSDLKIPGLLGRHAPGAVRISGEVHDLLGERRTRVVVAFDSSAVDDDLRRAIGADHVGRLILEALEPEGRYSVAATVTTRAGEDVRVELDLELEENAICFKGFLAPDGRRHGLPMHVESIRGRVRAGPEESDYERVTGFTRGGARVESSGHIKLDRVRGTVDAFDVPVDEELIAAAEQELGPGVRRIVRELGLKGTFDVAAHFEAAEDFSLTVEAHPKKLELEPAVFPYPLLCDGGKLVFQGDRIVFDDVRGGFGELGVRVRGSIDVNAEEAPIDLTIEAHDLPLDARLIEAARAIPDARLAQALERLRPSGHVDLVLTWRRLEARAPVEVTIDCMPTSVRLEALDGAVLVTDLGGAVDVHRVGDAPWQLELMRGGGLSAHALGGEIELSGQLTDEASGRASLRLVGRRISIDPRLVVAVRALSPEIADLLDSYQVRGRLSIECDVRPKGGRLEPTLVSVTPDVAPAGAQSADLPAEGIAADPPWLPLPLLWSAGSMRADLEAGTVSFERLSGRVGDAPLRVSPGQLRFTNDGLEVELGLHVDALSALDTIALVFGPQRRDAMRQYGLAGSTRADVARLRFRVPAGAAAVDHVEAGGALDLDGWRTETVGPLRDLSGRVELTSLRYENAGRGIGDVRADGKLDGVTLEVGAFRFANVESDLLVDHGRLSIPWLAADFAGGRLPRDRNHAGITLTGDMPFDGRLELQAADVSRILGDDLPRMRALAGRLDADVGFDGRGASLVKGQGLTSLEAAGTVSVENAKLWTIPLFDKLYSEAVLPLTGTSSDDVNLTGKQSGKAEPPKWERGRFDFALQGVHVRLSRIELAGEPLILRGEGQLGAERLALHFYPEVKSGVGWLQSIPLLGPLVGWILSLVEHEFGAFRFQGPYGNPEVFWDPVTFVPRFDLNIKLERPRIAEARRGARPARF
jgi:hypothetical protein